MLTNMIYILLFQRMNVWNVDRGRKNMYVDAKPVINKMFDILDFLYKNSYGAYHQGMRARHESWFSMSGYMHDINYLCFKVNTDTWASISEDGNVVVGPKEEVCNHYSPINGTAKPYFVSFSLLDWFQFKWKFKRAYKALEKEQHNKDGNGLLEVLRQFTAF